MIDEKMDDAINESYSTELNIDFDSMRNSERTLAFQYDPADKKNIHAQLTS